MARRFVFFPPLGPDGGPTTEARILGIDWRLPDLIGVAHAPSEPTAADYPPEALRDRAKGAAVVRYVVSVDGTPEQCELVETSGHASLDEASCRFVMRTFRFRPATGPDGRPVPEIRTERIVWSLP